MEYECIRRGPYKWYGKTVTLGFNLLVHFDHKEIGLVRAVGGLDLQPYLDKADHFEFLTDVIEGMPDKGFKTFKEGQRHLYLWSRQKVTDLIEQFSDTSGMRAAQCPHCHRKFFF